MKDNLLIEYALMLIESVFFNLTKMCLDIIQLAKFVIMPIITK